MSDLTVNGTSTWASGTPDTATTLSDGPTGSIGVAAQVNGVVQFALAVQSVLGNASTLIGSATDLSSRLNVMLAASGALQSGTSFPTSPPPINGQLFFRTDSKTIYVYDTSTGQWIFAFVNNNYALLDGTLTFTGPLAIRSVTPGIRLNGTEANAKDWTIQENAGTIRTFVNTGTPTVPVWTEDNFFVPTGGCIEFDGTVLPNGWVWADGAAYSRTLYPYSRLFAVTGTAFGVGDGSTTFNVRDKRGRVSIGVDVSTGRITSASVNGANAAVLGGTGGLQTHTLLIAEMPSHTHTVNTSLGTVTGTNSIMTTVTAPSATQTSNSTGGGGAHSNTQPWLACNFIVKT